MPGLLSLLVLVPLLGGLALACLPRRAEGVAPPLALLVSLAPLSIAVRLWTTYDPAGPAFQFTEHAAWLPTVGASWAVGIDGISLLLVGLAAVLMPLLVLSTPLFVAERRRAFLGALLVLEAAALGAFVALDLLLFYAFWELTVIPMFLLIGAWGGAQRRFAATKFLLFTMAGSLPMLAAILTVGLAHQQAAGSPSFALADLVGTGLAPLSGTLCFLAFVFALGVKSPLFPLHSWMPTAYAEAPIAAMVASGVLMKMGTYGFLRFVTPLFPDPMAASAAWFGTLAVVGVVYGAIIALRQHDLRRVMAWMSISHLGIVLLGIASQGVQGTSGAVYQMLGHSISGGAMLMLFGMLLVRRGSLDLRGVGGLWKAMPRWSGCLLVAVFASLGLPGMGGFVGEFLVLLGSFRACPAWAVGAAIGLVVGTVVLLRVAQSLLFGPLQAGDHDRPVDLTALEALLVAPLLAAALFMGVYPAPFFERMEPSVARVLAALPTAAADARALPAAHGGATADGARGDGGVAAAVGEAR